MTRTELMLGTLLAIVIVGVAALAGVLYLRPNAAAPPAQVAPASLPTSPSVIPLAASDTAIVGFAAAQRSASLWSNDAALVGVTATWVPGSESSEVRSGTSSWAYTFFSPASARVVVITVAGDQGAVVFENPVAIAPTPLPAGNWRQDSDAVLAALLRAGGDSFLRREADATVTMALTMNSATNRPEWFVSLISGQTGHSVTMLLDATSGEILELDEDAA